MTAGFVPPDGLRLTAHAAPGAGAATLAPGDTVNATVTRDLGEGRYQVNLDNTRMVVESKVPLAPQQELTLQVVETGDRLVLQAMPPSTGQGPASADAAVTAAIASTADQATTQATFSIGVDLQQAGAHVEASAGQASVPVGLASTAAGVAVHFSDGAVVPGVAYAPEAATQLPPQEIPTPTGAVTAALSTAEQPVPLPVETLGLPAENEAVFLLQQMAARAVVTTPAGESALALLQALPESMRGLAEALAAQSGTAPMELTVLSVASDGSVVAQAGDAQLALTLPQGIPVEAGQTLLAAVDGEALLSGAVRVNAETGAVSENVIDARLHAAGLGTTPAAREAASALIANALPVTRANVQALMALAAGYEGAPRADMLAAGAHLMAHDMPLSPPLAAGVAGILSGKTSVGDLLSQAMAQLQEAVAGASPDGAAAAQAQARQAADLLQAMAVLLDRPDTPQQLMSFLSSFGREPMAQAAMLLENAASSLIGGNATLTNLDAALAVLLPATGGQTAPVPEAGVVPADAVPPQTQVAGTSAQTVTSEVPALPPDAALASAPVTPEQAALAAERVLSELSRPGHPGVGTILPPTSLPPEGAMPDAEAVARLVREIAQAVSPERAAEAARELVERGETDLARAVTHELERTEREMLRNDPAINRLAEAAETLRDLGRRFVAYKAESIAGQRQDPAVLAGEIPFRMGNDDASGRLQVFYRRNKSKGKRWSARVVLDLETSNLGPVVGDMRFLKQDLHLKLFSATWETADFLGREAKELSAALHGKGFHCEPQFLVIPPAGDPAPRPDPFAGRDVPTMDRGSLDIEA